MKIKNFILPALLVVVLAGYVIYKQFSSTPSTQNNNQTLVPSETINPDPGQTTPVTTQAGYKDGQYAGDVANTIYGDVQVQIIITGGKITDVKMLKTPTKPGHTQELVASSFPILQSEALTSQKANVNIVSGATQNSEGFQQSLASALSQAS